MKLVRLSCLVALIPLWLASAAMSQTPTITTIGIKETGCIYIVGTTTTPCEIGPGMTLTVEGSNFGDAGGGVSLCDCNSLTIRRWTSTRVSGTVNWVTPTSTVSLETASGTWSNALPYTALGPVIESIAVGNCTYVPNKSLKQCVITPGTQVAIHGRYFGTGPGGEVATCDCEDATIDSWDPDWATNPSPAHNEIVVTTVDAVCGSTIAVRINEIWSNAVPYTTCGH